MKGGRMIFETMVDQLEGSSMPSMDQDELIVGSEVLKSKTSKEKNERWWLVVGGGLWLEEVLLKMSGQPSRVVCCK
jgi:hypothetical protein